MERKQAERGRGTLSQRREEEGGADEEEEKGGLVRNFFPIPTRLFLPSSRMRERLYVMGRMQSLRLLERKSLSSSSLTGEPFFQ